MGADGSWSNQVQNQVIIAGPNGQLLVYTPTPAFGNLIASIRAQSGTDPFGNAMLSGIVGYSHAGGTYFAVQNGASGSAALTSYYSAASAAGPYTLQGFIEASGGTMAVISEGALALQTGGSAGAITETLSSGLSGGAPVSQFTRSALSAGNDASAHDITSAWTIPAHDADNGALYVIETFVTASTGATAAESLTLGLDLNGGGTLVPLATLGAAFNGSAVSTTYGIHVRLIVVPGAGSSASNAQITLLGSLGDESANRLATNSANMSGHSNTTAFTTTVSNTIALYAQWGGAGGTGQSAGTSWSEFRRGGQD